MRSLSRLRTRCAFSVLEMIITVLIIGIIAAIAIPRFASSLDHYRANAAAKRVASDISYVRDQAMVQGVDQPLSFNIVSDSYSASSAIDPNSKANGYSVLLQSTPYPADITLADFGGSSTLTFDFYGQPSAGGTIAVQSGSEIVVVTVDAVTGLPSLP